MLKALTLLLGLCLWLPAAAANKAVWVLDLRGAIGVATSEYVVSGIDQAHEQNGQLIVLQMDTPGGLDSSMRQIIQRILSSRIPIATYVSPRGARAASAGTYILYASHIAAMSPATNLGAATPVQISAPRAPGSPDNDQESPPQPASTMERKIINDATAYIQGLAELRGRNSEWAQKAVREGASLPAEQALQLQVVDRLADNLEQLLEQLHGQTLQVNQQPYRLNLASAEIIRYQANWRHQFLSVITNPNVAYILMLLGVYGLLFEFSNPGMGIPGITGGICILLALYAFQVLPVNYAGVAIILLGVALMIAEALAPSFGILGIGGVVALIIGSIILIDTPVPAFQIALPVIAAVALSSAAFTFLIIGMLLKNRRNPLASGTNILLHQQAQVERFHQGQPMIHLQGEFWQVQSNEPLQLGDWVSVQAIDGLVLKVNKTKEPNRE